MIQLWPKSSKRQWKHVSRPYWTLLSVKKCPKTYRNTITAHLPSSSSYVSVFAKIRTKWKPQRGHMVHIMSFSTLSSNKPFLLTLDQVKCLRTTMVWSMPSSTTGAFFQTTFEFKPLGGTKTHWSVWNWTVYHMKLSGLSTNCQTNNWRRVVICGGD